MRASSATPFPEDAAQCLRHTGTDDTLAETFACLYREWLPGSGEELRDYPLFLQRLSVFPDVPEHEAVLDRFLPLK
jgi:AraC family transcriptional regulator